MKKVLLASTALGAAALIAGPAAAQDGQISLGVGGYYSTFFSIATQNDDSASDDYRATDVRHDGEIQFGGETTLDQSGLTVGFRTELEIPGGQSAAGQIDETYMYFEGSFGQLVLGSDDTAAYDMQYTAPAAGVGINSPTYTTFNATGGAITATRLAAGGDRNKIKYFTPRFSGFQLGVSYQPDGGAFGNVGGDSMVGGGAGNKGGLSQADNGDVQHLFSGGANFVESFSGFDVAVAAGAEWGDREDNAPANADDYYGFSGGLNVGFSGFTAGGSVRWDNAGFNGNRDSLAWDIGLTYGTGPWTVGITWFDSESEDPVSGEDERHVLGVGADYVVSPGLTVSGAFQYHDSEDGATGNDADSYGVLIGTRLSF